MFGALKRGFRSMAGLILVRNVFGELRSKRTLAASRGFLAAARLSCSPLSQVVTQRDPEWLNGLSSIFRPKLSFHYYNLYLSNCWLITYCSVECVYADYAHDQRKMWEASRGGPVIRRIFEIHVKVRIFLRDYRVGQIK